MENKILRVFKQLKKKTGEIPPITFQIEDENLTMTVWSTIPYNFEIKGENLILHAQEDEGTKFEIEDNNLIYID